MKEQEENSSEPTGKHWPSVIPRWIGMVFLAYASIMVLARAKDFLVPVVLAFLLSMVFAPVRRMLSRRGIPAGVSALVIVLILLAGFSSIVVALAVPVSNWVANAPKIERQVQGKIRDVSASLNGLYEANDRIKEVTQPKHGSSDVQKVQLEDKGLMTNAAVVAPNMLAQFMFTFVLLLFLLASGDMFYEKLVHVMPTLKDKRRAMRIVYSIERQLSRYLLAITLINACLGVAVGVAMWLIGMPNPVVFGVIAFIFNFIPYLGAIAGILVAAMVALVAFSGFMWAFVVAGVYFCLTAIEGQIITPYFVGRELRVNTVMIFLAVSFWAWLWSAVGMIVAVPLLVMAKTFCDHIDPLHELGDFLSERHAERDE